MVQQFKQYLFIGIGGMIGAFIRYQISVILSHFPGNIPLATLIVNLAGCFLLSFLLYHSKIKEKISPELLLALTVGVIGSFTTFSTVTVEIVEFWNISAILSITYIVTSVFGGIILCFFGYKFAQKLGGSVK